MTSDLNRVFEVIVLYVYHSFAIVIYLSRTCNSKL